MGRKMDVLFNNKEVTRLVNRINRRKLRNNAQRALLSLLMRNGEWMARTTLRMPNVGSRFRDLRKLEFGGFKVECVTATKINRTRPSKITSRPTYYRVVPKSVSVHALKQAFKGVI